MRSNKPTKLVYIKNIFDTPYRRQTSVYIQSVHTPNIEYNIEFNTTLNIEINQSLRNKTKQTKTLMPRYHLWKF